MTSSSSFKQDLPDIHHTQRFAGVVARALQGGEFLALDGDLGAGKTSFTRALTQTLACPRLATSPTFALIQTYRGGRLPVLHADFYRLHNLDELDDLGWEETLADWSQGVVVVEWANRFPDRLPIDRLHIRWQFGSHDDERCVEVLAEGPSSSRILQILQASCL